MATLLQPPVMHGRVVSGGGNKDKQAQRPWWDGNKPVSPRQPWQLGGNEARAVANQVLSVLRCDGEFLQAGRPPPVPRDVFWLRFLEKKQGKQQQIRGGLALREDDLCSRESNASEELLQAGGCMSAKPAAG